MSNYARWKEVKKNMTALSEEEKKEVDQISDIMSKIIQRREEMGISQRELEKLTGIKQEAICRIENMKNIPKLDTLIRLMEPLGLRIFVNRV